MQQHINNFLIQEQIGKGSTGKVFKACDTKKKEDNIFALKVQAFCSKEEKECVQYFSGLRFQNIVNHYENFDFKLGLQQLNCTVMDYCNSGDLYNYLRNNRHLLNMFHRQEIIFQIGFGLWEISQLGIIHRDIKPQNIMVHCAQNTFRFQICDLGLSKQKSNASTLNIGTPYYMAPELIDENQAKGKYDSSVDIWAFGGLIYDLYTPQQLFNGNSLNEIFNSVKNKKIDFDLQQNVKDEHIRELIYNMIQISPDKRLKIDDILNKLDRQRFIKQKQEFQKENQQWFDSSTQSQIKNTIMNFNKPDKVPPPFQPTPPPFQQNSFIPATQPQRIIQQKSTPCLLQPPINLNEKNLQQSNIVQNQLILQQPNNQFRINTQCIAPNFSVKQNEQIFKVDAQKNQQQSSVIQPQQIFQQTEKFQANTPQITPNSTVIEKETNFKDDVQQNSYQESIIQYQQNFQQPNNQIDTPQATQNSIVLKNQSNFSVEAQKESHITASTEEPQILLKEQANTTTTDGTDPSIPETNNQKLDKQIIEEIKPVLDINSQPYSNQYVLNRATLGRYLKDQKIIDLVSNEIDNKSSKDNIKALLSEYLNKMISELRFE